MNIFVVLLALVLVLASLLWWLRGQMRDTRAKKRYAAFRAQPFDRPFVRTPEERFEELEDYPFTPHYLEIDGLRVHYLDEGDPHAPPVLLLHGEPSWSYLYRTMIPPLIAGGYRVIAPDLIGFGRSDKLTRPIDISYQMHVDTMKSLVEKLELVEATLFCQDWGGLIGLRVALELPNRFAAIVVANTALPGQAPQGSFAAVSPKPKRPPKRGRSFLAWLLYSQFKPAIRAGDVLQMGTVTRLSPAIQAAYDAPFPTKAYKAGFRKFPRIVLSGWEENTRAWQQLAHWDKPLLTLFSDKDPIMRGGERLFQKVVPGAQGQAHTTIKQAGHFLQEDQGPVLAEHLLAFMETYAPPKGNEGGT